MTDSPERSDRPDRKAPRVRKALPAQLAPRDHKELKALPGRPVRSDPPVPQDRKASPDPRARMDLTVLPDRKVLQER